MSQNPRKKTPIRRVSSAPAPAPAPAPEPEVEKVEEFDYEEEQEYAGSYDYADSYRESRPANKTPRTSRSAARGLSQQNYREANASPKRNLYPYIMGGIIGALVVGIMALAYLLGTGNRSAPANLVSNPASNPVNSSSGNQPTQQPRGTTVEPVRMPMADFKALYDDPAKRPLIVDVRAADRYAEGHIEGAVNIPDAETETRLAEYPKDRLIVAYCQ